MQTFIIRRMLSGIVILFVLSVAVFLLLRIVPGDPAIRICQLNCTKAQIDQIHRDLGLDKPYFPVSLDFTDPKVVSFSGDSQYGTYITNLMTGDLGTSNFNHKPVAPQVIDRMPVTPEIMALTLIFTLVVGIPFGVVSAVFRNSPADLFVRSTSVLGLAIPSFWIATLVLVFPSELWGLRTRHRQEDLAVPGSRGELQASGANRRGARAGLRRRHHAAHAIVAAGSDAAGLHAYGSCQGPPGRLGDYPAWAQELDDPGDHRAGSADLRSPGRGDHRRDDLYTSGLGLFTLQSLAIKDYDVVQTMTLYAGVTVVVINLMVDVSYAWLDPGSATHEGAPWVRTSLSSRRLFWSTIGIAARGPGAGARLRKLGTLLRQEPAGRTRAAHHRRLRHTRVFAPFIAPYSPTDFRAGNPDEGLSASHIFGTERVGRDIFSRFVYGGRVSLSVAVISVVGARRSEC